MPADPDAFGLKLQRLGSDNQRVLVVADVVSTRSEDQRFKTSEIDSFFGVVRVPPPTNTSARLGDLRNKKLVFKGKDGRWAVTPEGQVEAAELVGEIDPAKLEAELASIPGAELGQVRHSVISPYFAPQRWLESIARLLDKHPFEKNVFLMTRFPKDKNDKEFLDPVSAIINPIRDVLKRHGLHLHRADDQQLDDELFANVAAHMWACQYGIGLLEDRLGRGLNQNVVIELGAMVMTGRRCAMLRDSSTQPDIPTDFVGHIYKSVDFDDVPAVCEAIHRWVSKDLQLGRCEECPPA